MRIQKILLSTVESYPAYFKRIKAKAAELTPIVDAFFKEYKPNLRAVTVFDYDCGNVDNKEIKELIYFPPNKRSQMIFYIIKDRRYKRSQHWFDIHRKLFEIKIEWDVEIYVKEGGVRSFDKNSILIKSNARSDDCSEPLIIPMNFIHELGKRTEPIEYITIHGPIYLDLDLGTIPDKLYLSLCSLNNMEKLKTLARLDDKLFIDFAFPCTCAVCERAGLKHFQPLQLVN